MAPMATATYSTVALLLHSHKNPKPTRHSLCFTNLSLPPSASKFNPPSITSSRAPVLSGRVCRIRGLVNDDSFTLPEPESENSEEGASIDLSLPRRRLLVQFTCGVCGERAERLVNRLAYERGSIFVQCAGCLQHHKLVDNLGLVTEYDFREKMNVDSGNGEI